MCSFDQVFPNMTVIDIVASFKAIISNIQVYEFDMKVELEKTEDDCPKIAKKRVSINYNSISDLITSMREAILTNLLLNPNFKSHMTQKVDYINFFKLFESTEVNVLILTNYT